jgi:hypothetical protein
MRPLFALVLFFAPTLDTMPMEGYVERRTDGSCWYAAKFGDPMQQVKQCPDTTVGHGAPAKDKPLEPAPDKGYLEKEVATGTCWWSLHVPYDCPKGATCKPNPPVKQVACPKPAEH